MIVNKYYNKYLKYKKKYLDLKGGSNFFSTLAKNDPFSILDMNSLEHIRQFAKPIDYIFSYPFSENNKNLYYYFNNNLNAYPVIYSSSTVFAAVFNNTIITWGNWYNRISSKEYGPKINTLKQEKKIKYIYSTTHNFAVLLENKEVIIFGPQIEEPYFLKIDQIPVQVKEIYVTNTDFCFLLLDKTVLIWDNKKYKKLDDDPQVKKICANKFAFAAITTTDEVITWSSNSDPYFDYTSNYQKLKDKDITFFCNPKFIFATETAFAILKEDKTVISWDCIEDYNDYDDKLDKLLINITNIKGTLSEFIGLCTTNMLVRWTCAKGYNNSVIYAMTETGWLELTVDNINDDCFVKDNTLLFDSICSTDKGVGILKREKNKSSILLWNGSNNTDQIVLNKFKSSEENMLPIKKIFSNKKLFIALINQDKVPTDKEEVPTDKEEVPTDKEVQTDKEQIITTGDYYDRGKIPNNLNKNQHIFSSEESFAALDCFGKVVIWGGIPYSFTDVVCVFSTENAFAVVKKDCSIIACLSINNQAKSNPGSDTTDVQSELNKWIKTN